MQDLINTLRKNLYKASSGLSCHFIPIDKKMGIKLYSTKEERDFAYKNQKKYYKKGIAPNTFGKINLDRRITLFVNKRFGYFTQRATKVERLSLKEFKYLEKKLKKLKLTNFADDIDYDHNVGKIGRKTVCIDFDQVSLE